MTVVGRSIARIDGPARTTGEARYAADLAPGGLLHGVFVRSPHPHARVTRVDDLVARGMPGVVDVLTAARIERLVPGGGRYDIACGSLDRPADTPTMPGDPRLFDPIVRFVGEPVALVVAESERIARAAAEAVEVDYELLPAILTPQRAREPDAPQLHGDIPGNVAASVHWQGGDPDRAMAGAALVVERTFRTQRQKHAQLEPTVCVAEPDGAGGVIVHAPSQVPHRLRHTLAVTFGLPVGRVRVVVPAIGGAFGKNEGLSAEPYAVAATLVTGHPVRVTYERHEDLTVTDVRHPAEMTLRGGFRADGSLAALVARATIDAGAYLGHSGVVAPVVMAQLLATYRLEAFDVEAVAVFTNHQSSGAFRGYGGPQAVFPLECLIDLACRELRVDPLAARRAMHIRAGDPFGPLGVPIEGSAFERTLDAGAAAFGWADRADRRAAAGLGRPTRRRGFGMAAVAWKSGIVGAGFDHSAAVASLEPDGSVALAAASPDLGTGIHTTLVQVCAEAFGVGVDLVRLGPTDTAVTPFDVGAFASRSLYRMGSAVERAARELRRLVLAEAAELLEIDPADLDVAGSAVVVRGSPERAVPLSAVARRVLHDGRELRARGEAPPTMAPAFAVQFVELDVDVETGEVAVTRVVTAQEVGRAINPAIVVGQVDGAVVQGLGYALFEDLAADPETGTIVTSTLADYPIATAVDVPPMEVVLVETPDATGPFGARGVGEPAITLTAPAVANALLDALGVAPTSLPLSPMRIRAAIRAGA